MNYIIMITITTDDCVYFVHPVYDLYAGSKDGNTINIIKRVPHKGNKKNSGYLGVNVRKHAQPSRKTYLVHRFIWECFNGIIPDGKEIDHINDKRDDNRLSNLQLMTPKENCKKAAENRDYTSMANNRKCVKATNENTKEVSHYYSLHAAEQHLEINKASVRRVCEGLQKSGVSKKDGCSYRFEYIKQDELSDNYKKSSNIRPRRVSNEDKRKHYLE